MKALDLKTLATLLACWGVRNSSLEDLHAGITPSSKIGDFTDVKVVSPYGEIPWARLSRISDAEMKTLMIEVVNRIFTLLHLLETPPGIRIGNGIGGLKLPTTWNEPEFDAEILKWSQR